MNSQGQHITGFVERRVAWFGSLFLKVHALVNPCVTSIDDTPAETQRKVILLLLTLACASFNVILAGYLLIPYWAKPYITLPFFFISLCCLTASCVIVITKRLDRARSIAIWGTFVGTLVANVLHGGLSKSKSMDLYVVLFPICCSLIYPPGIELFCIVTLCISSCIGLCITELVVDLDVLYELPTLIHCCIWVFTTLSLLTFVHFRELQITKAMQQVEESSIAVKVLTEKNAFISVVAHEIRTPLNALIGVLSIFGHENLTLPQQKHLQVMSTASESMFRVISDVLDHFMIDQANFKLSPAATDLRTTLKEALDLYTGLCKAKNLNQILDVHSSCPKYIHCDAGRLQQVLSNLVSNAIKFAPHGTEVTTKVVLAEDDSMQRLCFSVVDGGQGIPDEKQKLLWKPFTQLSDSVQHSAGGTGLGLSIVKKIVKLMGGEVAYRRKNPGSCFSFQIPITEALEHPRTKIKGKTPLDTPLGCALSILVSDDNDLNWYIMKNFAEKAGCFATHACNGAEAVSAVRAMQKKGEAFDLIFMDMWMPVMSGVEAIEAIRKLGITTRIVIVTADCMQNQTTGTSQADDIMYKPILPSHFMKQLKSVTGFQSPAVSQAVSQADLVEGQGTSEQKSAKIQDRTPLPGLCDRGASPPSTIPVLRDEGRLSFSTIQGLDEGCTSPHSKPGVRPSPRLQLSRSLDQMTLETPSPSTSGRQQGQGANTGLKQEALYRVQKRKTG